jgi:hypothetical protein
MPEDQQQGEAKSLTGVIGAVRRAGDGGDEMSVADILHEIGECSFATALLVPALILISPVSGIPGVPTMGAIIVILIVGQWIWRRPHLWLPDFVLRRSVNREKMHKALDWFDRPAAFVDRHTHERLKFLASGPFRIAVLGVILLIAASWPLLEILPLVTSVGAFAVSLFAFGLFMRDGLFVLAGFVFVGVLAALVTGLI